ncbi:hypothetical protein [Microbacterium aquimaris]|uniref:Uncharacterized protein n=1 Tax=Microbacterium aquimaris TaxID=459816 RepID=A0ABU5N6Y4_9MICO|nr:hypothetical protein [Microbacterium aquimaris]MDZ8161811.1 hypothetical protein [Microbacterium aquimaris]
MATAVHSATLAMPVVLVGVALVGTRTAASTPPHRRMRVVGIAAHPDGLELAAGATLARWAAEGAAVHGLVTEGGIDPARVVLSVGLWDEEGTLPASDLRRALVAVDGVMPVGVTPFSAMTAAHWDALAP